jgi:hypothetical protein
VNSEHILLYDKAQGVAKIFWNYKTNKEAADPMARDPN